MGIVLFIGEHSHILDDKGRITIPSKFREDLGDDFVITKGLDSCLFIYPQHEWKIFEEKLKTLPLTNKNARAFARFFFAGANESILDKQGRVLLPPNLRIHASLIKDAVIIGVSTRIEIWSKEKWDEYTGDENLSYEVIAENMEDLGI